MRKSELMNAIDILTTRLTVRSLKKEVIFNLRQWQNHLQNHLNFSHVQMLDCLMVRRVRILGCWSTLERFIECRKQILSKQ